MMAAANAAASLDSGPAASADEAEARAVRKRYHGLVKVRTKAINGKGAWYWAHLEPILVVHSDTGTAKAVKLRCSLCEAVFSASNPSRTASEHLKRGTCPNFASAPKPISSIPPSPAVATSSPPPTSPRPHTPSSSRKRNSAASQAINSTSSYQISPLSVADPSPLCSAEIMYSSTPAEEAAALPLPLPPPPLPQQHLMLSGGKEDLGALAMLEDSVKRLKSPKASPGPVLTRSQIDSAVGLLVDWLFESCSGNASFSSIEHPKFKAFLHQVGLPPISSREITGPRLNARYEAARVESEAKIRDAFFFQIASDGWKQRNGTGPSNEENLVNIAVNLPNGTNVYARPVFTPTRVASKYAEEILWETITRVCGGDVKRCAGIVADRFKAKALRNLESQNHWMVNLSCQLQAFTSLIKDFFKELQLFKTVTDKCFMLANFFNNKTQVRNSFLKYQLQEPQLRPGLLRVSPDPGCIETLTNSQLVCAMLEDILNHSRPLQLATMDESYRTVCADDPNAGKVAEMIRDSRFWSELEAVLSLVNLVKTMTQEMELDRPLIGQCLPLWEELRTKVKDWCSKYSIAEGPMERVIDRRFKKNYHPAWSAAFILDPLYLIRDASGKYLPPFKRLKPEQEKDVDKLITRLVSREEAHIALMELMKWRSDGLDPLYAQAVQVKQRDPVTGKMKAANPPSSRLVWETCLSEFKSLGKVAVRLIFLHATSCRFKWNCSFLRWICTQSHTKVGMDRVQKIVFIAAHSKLERRDFSSDDDTASELLSIGSSTCSCKNLCSSTS